MSEQLKVNTILLTIPELLINKNTGSPVAIEIIQGKLTDFNKAALKETGLPIGFYNWLRRVAKLMKSCGRKSAPSRWGTVLLLDDSFEERPFYPVELCDVELAGLLGIDVMYITRIQKERHSFGGET